MNTQPGHGHLPPAASRPRRAAALAAVVAAALGLLTAACSSNPATTAASSGPPTYAQMVAYAECIRTHGDPAWPDPVKGPGGLWVFESSATSGMNAPGAQGAANACKKLQPKQTSMPPSVVQTVRAQLLKLATCMRAHGITNFPDPTVGSSVVGINVSGLDMNSPQYQTAEQACRAYELHASGGGS
jgi:hypothetical protein